MSTKEKTTLGAQKKHKHTKKRMICFEAMEDFVTNTEEEKKEE